ncbi:MAG: peptide ABC transporter substrate-binding protein [Solobacterium sp.]|nr:peptide ABC transporter substrate-binding protein [Solobacterium sp.]
MQKWKKMLITALSAAMFAGCSSSSGGEAGNGNTSTETDSAGKPITIALTSNLMTMDATQAADGSSLTMLSACMSGLTMTAKDGTMVPDMAEWEVSEDGLTYTFHIFEDAKWSNGDPVTAHDFVYSWRRLADPAMAADYQTLPDTLHIVNAAEVISGEKPTEELGVRAVDDKTFEVSLSLPCEFLLSLVSFPPFYPINQAFVEAEGDAYAQGIDHLLYNGEYTMTGWEEGASYTFTKNPDYVHADEFKNESLVFRIVLETQTAILEYQQGNINILTMTGEMVDLYKNEPGFHTRKQASMWYLSPMVNDPIMSNKDLREAISYAVDREAITSSVLKDGSIPAVGIIGRDFAFDANGVDFRDSSEDLCGYDPEKAKEAFARAKETLGDTITIDLYYEDSDSAKAVAENIQQMLVTTLEGLEITMTCKPKKTRIQDMLSHNFQLMLTLWGPDYADPQSTLDVFTTGAAINGGDYSSAEYDELIAKATKGEDAADAEARWQDMIEAEKIMIAQDHAVIPLYQVGSAMMITPGIEDVLFFTTGTGTYRYVHWKE